MILVEDGGIFGCYQIPYSMKYGFFKHRSSYAVYNCLEEKCPSPKPLYAFVTITSMF